MDIVYIVIGVVILAVLIWFFTRKKQPEALPEAPEPKQLERRKEPAGARAVQKKQPEPAAPAKKVEPKPATKLEAAEPEPKAEPSEIAAPQVVAEPAQPEEPQPLSGEHMKPSSLARPARDVEGLRKRLGKSRSKEGFFGRLARLITGRKELDPAIVDELEEVLLSSDVGVATTQKILDRIREGLDRKELDDTDKVWEALRQEARRILSVGEGGMTLRSKPTTVLLVGVNGSGKTTTIGKLATQLKASGRTPLLAAGDTFRAAAVAQLEVWGRRVGCDVVKGKDGADPAAVIFEAVQKSVQAGADVLLADTAGRLHTKTPLMEEIKKVSRTMGKAMDGAPHEIFLVIDATNGQNAVAQSRLFAEALPLSGIILTKLDGTAKGGVILGICDELKVPVRYIGIGERPDDLRPFDVDEFVEALLGAGMGEDVEAA